MQSDTRALTAIYGWQSLPVPDVSDAQAAVTRALTHRIVGAHRLNRSSNRSHCMLTFHLESTPSTVRDLRLAGVALAVGGPHPPPIGVTPRGKGGPTHSPKSDGS